MGRVQAKFRQAICRGGGGGGGGVSLRQNNGFYFVDIVFREISIKLHGITSNQAIIMLAGTKHMGNSLLWRTEGNKIYLFLAHNES